MKSGLYTGYVPDIRNPSAVDSSLNFNSIFPRLGGFHAGAIILLTFHREICLNYPALY